MNRARYASSFFLIITHSTVLCYTPFVLFNNFIFPKTKMARKQKASLPTISLPLRPYNYSSTLFEIIRQKHASISFYMYHTPALTLQNRNRILRPSFIGIIFLTSIIDMVCFTLSPSDSQTQISFLPILSWSTYSYTIFFQFNHDIFLTAHTFLLFSSSIFLFGIFGCIL